MTKIRAWHFVADNRLLRDGQKLKVGKTYHHKGFVKMCHSGLHASRRVLDALYFAPGCILCEVEVGGVVEEDTDKLVCRNRTVLSATDATNVLHEFACQVTEQMLGAVGAEDERSWHAIDAKRAWLRGDIGDTELDAAWDAAWGAARDEAWHVAAWDAAGGAARVAARAAARAAAWGAAWDDLNDLLTDMVK